MFVVEKPVFVVVKRQGGKPAFVSDVQRAFVEGGTYVKGTGYKPGEQLDPKRFSYSYGFRTPQAIKLVRRGGGEAIIEKVAAVLFGGGTPVDKAEFDRLDALASKLDQQMNTATSVEIVDDSRVDVVDNGATLQLADPVPRGDFRDDFWEQVKQFHEAAIGPQGQLLDEFDQRWQAANQHHQDLSNIAPFTRSNPPTVLHGILGSQVTVVMSKGFVTAAYWVGEDAETTPVTVTLTPVQSAADLALQNSPGFIRAYARITFGTRAYSTKVEVDVGSGCQFTLSGSMVTVDFALEPIVDVNVPDPVFDLAAMLSFKQIMRTAPTTRTRYLDSTTGVATAKSATFVTVPPFAKNVIFWREAPTVAFNLYFTDYTGTLVYSYVVAANAYMTDPIPLSPDVQYVGVSPNGTISEGRFIFGLSI